MTDTLLVKRSYDLRCGKCGAEITLRVADHPNSFHQHGRSLRELSRVLEDGSPFPGDDFGWREGVDCPLCTHSRGGSYPLYRVIKADEFAAFQAYEAAAIAAIGTPAPDDFALDEPSAEADDDSPEWQAYFRAEDAYDAEWKKYDEIQKAEKDARAALAVFGYDDDEIDDISSLAERRRLEAERAPV